MPPPPHEVGRLIFSAASTLNRVWCPFDEYDLLKWPSFDLTVNRVVLLRARSGAMKLKSPLDKLSKRTIKPVKAIHSEIQLARMTIQLLKLLRF